MGDKLKLKLLLPEVNCVGSSILGKGSFGIVFKVRSDVGGEGCPNSFALKIAMKRNEEELDGDREGKIYSQIGEMFNCKNIVKQYRQYSHTINLDEAREIVIAGRSLESLAGSGSGSAKKCEQPDGMFQIWLHHGATRIFDNLCIVYIYPVRTVIS